jgi:hypothetical protein
MSTSDLNEATSEKEIQIKVKMSSLAEGKSIGNASLRKVESKTKASRLRKSSKLSVSESVFIYQLTKTKERGSYETIFVKVKL